MSKPIRCPCCGKRSVQIRAQAALDGRPVYKCGNCEYTYTSGDPYANHSDGKRT